MTNYKVLFLLIFIGLSNMSINAQKSQRIGYIDTEYILENIPDYQEASRLLEQKISKWKIEAEAKLKEIEQKKKQLENESALLTRELYEERMEEIAFDESEVLNFQEKRFGPNGDVVLQKRQLMQPIQDQIYAAVQDIAERRKYDFIFDKNSDFLMLYSAERYDISDLIIRTITRADRRKQANSFEERKALREEEAHDDRSFEDIEREAEITAQQAKRDSLLSNRRAQREADLAERKRRQDSAREARRMEAEARRQKALEKRNAQNETGKSADSTSSNIAAKTAATAGAAKATTESESKADPANAGAGRSGTEKTAAEIQEERRQQKLKEREDRRKALEERKQKILEQRKKAREEREARARKQDSIAKAKKEGTKEKNEKEGETENNENNN